MNEFEFFAAWGIIVITARIGLQRPMDWQWVYHETHYFQPEDMFIRDFEQTPTSRLCSDTCTSVTHSKQNTKSRIPFPSAAYNIKQHTCIHVPSQNDLTSCWL